MSKLTRARSLVDSTTEDGSGKASVSRAGQQKDIIYVRRGIGKDEVT